MIDRIKEYIRHKKHQAKHFKKYIRLYKSWGYGWFSRKNLIARFLK